MNHIVSRYFVVTREFLLNCNLIRISITYSNQLFRRVHVKEILDILLLTLDSKLTCCTYFCGFLLNLIGRRNPFYLVIIQSLHHQILYMYVTFLLFLVCLKVIEKPIFTPFSFFWVCMMVVDDDVVVKDCIEKEMARIDNVTFWNIEEKKARKLHFNCF